MVNSSPVTGQDAFVPSFCGDEKTFGAACLASVLAGSADLASVVGVAANANPANTNEVRIDFMAVAPSFLWHLCQMMLHHWFASPAPCCYPQESDEFPGLPAPRSSALLPFDG